MVAVLACGQTRGGRLARGHSFTDETGGHDAGLHDLPTIAGVVSAVDAAPGKLDDRIRAIKLCAPGAVRGCILLEGLPGRLHRARG